MLSSTLLRFVLHSVTNCPSKRLGSRLIVLFTRWSLVSSRFNSVVLSHAVDVLSRFPVCVSLEELCVFQTIFNYIERKFPGFTKSLSIQLSNIGEAFFVYDVNTTDSFSSPSICSFLSCINHKKVVSLSDVEIFPYSDSSSLDFPFPNLCTFHHGYMNESLIASSVNAFSSLNLWSSLRELSLNVMNETNTLFEFPIPESGKNLTKFSFVSCHGGFEFTGLQCLIELKYLTLIFDSFTETVIFNCDCFPNVIDLTFDCVNSVDLVSLSTFPRLNSLSINHLSMIDLNRIVSEFILLHKLSINNVSEELIFNPYCFFSLQHLSIMTKKISNIDVQGCLNLSTLDVSSSRTVAITSLNKLKKLKSYSVSSLNGDIQQVYPVNSFSLDKLQIGDASYDGKIWPQQKMVTRAFSCSIFLSELTLFCSSFVFPTSLSFDYLRMLEISCEITYLDANLFPRVEILRLSFVPKLQRIIGSFSTVKELYFSNSFGSSEFVTISCPNVEFLKVSTCMPDLNVVKTLKFLRILDISRCWDISLIRPLVECPRLNTVVLSSQCDPSVASILKRYIGEVRKILFIKYS
ncbi:hypothetical protein RCL1_001188 [Eukaryota sp. TZLM3-RCL]